MNKEREALQKIATMLKGSRIADIATEALQSESRMYSEEEVIDFARWVRIHDNLFKNEVWTIQQLRSKYELELQSLQPKTEEVSQESEEQKQQRYTVELVKEIEHEFKEQPSPSIEKMAEEFYIDFGQANMKMTITCGEIRKYRIDAFIEGYKANNHLEELEKEEPLRKFINWLKTDGIDEDTQKMWEYGESLLSELKTKQ